MRLRQKVRESGVRSPIGKKTSQERTCPTLLLQMGRSNLVATDHDLFVQCGELFSLVLDGLLR